MWARPGHVEKGGITPDVTEGAGRKPLTGLIPQQHRPFPERGQSPHRGLESQRVGDATEPAAPPRG